MVRGLCQGREALEWTVADGWEPLCKFMEKSIPDIAFPSGNTSPETLRRVAEVQKRRMQIANRNAGVLGVVATALIVLIFAIMR